MEMKVERITPQRAKELLNLNTDNWRALDKRRVRLLADEMSTGNWELNGESIKVNGQKLIDGQHRLHAVVQSGTTINSLVVYGVQSAGLTVDRGKPRTLGQCVAHLGVKSANDIAAIAKLCVVYKNGAWTKEQTHGYWGDHEVFEYVRDNVKVLETALIAARRTSKFVPKSIVGAIVVIGCQDVPFQKSELAQWFVSALATGLGYSKDDAVYHLRERVKKSTKMRPLSTYAKRMLTTMAWNKTMLGETCTSNQLFMRLSGPGKTMLPETILQASY